MSTKDALIVAGGVGKGRLVLSTVEVMNTRNLQWSTTSDLPEPMYWSSSTTCEGHLYMLGGIDHQYCYTTSVYSCSVQDLLQSCIHNSQTSSVVQEKSVNGDAVWREVVAHLPVKASTCESFDGRLVAFGGMDDTGKPTRAVYMYNSSKNSWEIVSHMTTARCYCYTAVVHVDTNILIMVVGGWKDTSSDVCTMTDEVELTHAYF